MPRRVCVFAAMFASLIVVATATVSPAATADPADPADIPSAWRACQQDSECAVIKACGDCCPLHSINTLWIEAYEKLSQKECKDPDKPACPCTRRKPVCNQGLCD
jgi:hypothetical protein